MIGRPPVWAGAAHDTETCALPARALTDSGGVGVAYGITAELAALAGLEPEAFLPVTVNV